MRVSIEDGWVPARLLQINGRTHVLAVKRPARPLRAPFLEFDLDERGERAVLSLDKAMDRMAVADRAPAGLIFHMSRTGSSTAGVMLRATGQCEVLSEPIALGNLFSRDDDGEEERLERQVRFLLSWLIEGLGGGRPVVLKAPSWLALHLDRFRRWYPDVPCAFMYREAVEVVSALVEQAPFLFQRARMRASADDGADGRAQWQRIVVSLRHRVDYRADYSYVEFVARFLGAICQPPAEAYASGAPIVPVDYATFKAQLTDVLAPLFGLSLDDAARTRMAEAGRYNVKSMSRQVPFTGDSMIKQMKATPLMRDMAARHVQPWIDLLRA